MHFLPKLVLASLLATPALAIPIEKKVSRSCSKDSAEVRVGLIPSLQNIWANETAGLSLPLPLPSVPSTPPLFFPSSPLVGSGGEPLPRFVLYGDRYNGGTLGVPNPSDIKGFNIYNVAFWMSKGGPSDNVLAWTQGTDAQRTRRKKQYNDAGIKLLVSLFGEVDKPQSNGNDPVQLAKKVASFVKKYQFDGVDVDYEELDLFANGKATPWLKQFTVTLRKELPSPQYLISHAPLAPWFSNAVYGANSYLSILNDPFIGGGVDFYNVQFYNQDDYETLEHLLFKSTDVWPKTSLFQIGNHVRTLAQGRLSKLVIGKPARKSDANNGYMSPELLAECYFVARDRGWDGGLMFFEYPNINGRQLAAIREMAAQRYRKKRQQQRQATGGVGLLK